jgi:type IV secretory pathway ATPase VirB11/archaellum biosynthesis ATPase
MSFLLIGETGKRKSALVNSILEEVNIFKSAATDEGATEVTSCKTRNVNGINRSVIDTPDFSDSNGQGAIHIADMVDFLKNYQKDILVITLVVQIFDYRVSQDLQKVIQQLNIMFNNPEI